MAIYEPQHLAEIRRFKELIEAEQGPIIPLALRLGIWTQADLARASGLTPNTINELKTKKASRSTKAAILWALTVRTLSL